MRGTAFPVPVLAVAFVGPHGVGADGVVVANVGINCALVDVGAAYIFDKIVIAVFTTK